MKKKQILKDYTNKIKQFKKYNKAYFEDDNLDVAKVRANVGKILNSLKDISS